MNILTLIKKRIHKSCFIWDILRTPSQRKYILRWIRSLQRDYLIKTKQPWIVFEAIDFLNSCHLKEKNVFEYGSGGSTLFWLERGANIVSVEHDPGWYVRLRGLTQNYRTLDYRLVKAEPVDESTAGIVNPDYSDPDHYISAEYELHKVHYKNYVCQIDSFDNDYFDIVLIDGRARPSCIKHSINKVRPGGMLILDNLERDYYTHKTKIFLQNFECKIFWGVGPQNEVFWQTGIYVKK